MPGRPPDALIGCPTCDEEGGGCGTFDDEKTLKDRRKHRLPAGSRGEIELCWESVVAATAPRRRTGAPHAPVTPTTSTALASGERHLTPAGVDGRQDTLKARLFCCPVVRASNFTLISGGQGAEPPAALRVGDQWYGSSKLRDDLPARASSPARGPDQNVRPAAPSTWTHSAPEGVPATFIPVLPRIARLRLVCARGPLPLADVL